MQVDVLVVGAGPAGSSAARCAAEAGLRVLLVERRTCVGLPVQCAELVPAQIRDWAPLSPGCIAQPVDSLCTHLPDGGQTKTTSRGFILQRAAFDQALAVQAVQAGAELWTSARAVAPAAGGVQIERQGHTEVVACEIVIGADGPRSAVGRWIGHENRACLEARQVEVVLKRPSRAAHVFFDAAYPGGYGWLFPKGDTANVGVGVSRRMGGNSPAALAHLLAALQGEIGPAIASTGGLIPVAGPVAQAWSGNTLLAGDAAGHTHPITGGGIYAAVVAGTLAGRAAAQAVKQHDQARLAAYTEEMDAFMGRSLRHASAKRRALEAGWNDNPRTLSALVRSTWIAYPGYRTA